MTQAVLRPHDQLTHDEFTAISKAVHEFEALWRQTRSPAIEPFLPEVSDPLRLRLLIELLRIDQEHRWERGDRRLLEQYLQEWPELSEQPVAIQELLSAECLTRFCLEDSPTLDELRQRFPQFADGVDLDRLRATAIAEKGEASTAKAVNDATVITFKSPPVDDENGLHPTASFPPKAESSAVLAARRIGLLTGKQFGRYEVRRLVGTGGMGAVYEARDTQLERIVALKIPRGELVNDPVILQRFLNEARAAGAIRHPHICPIYDVGKIDEQHFITMPLVQGMSLSAWMEHRTVSLHEAAELTRKLASALQAIHAVGIRHRDIKASNVMIDERGEPLLMDFGLARLAQTDTHVTQSGSLVGTPAYMAPEQIQLGASGGDERSDVYSLGVLLYQMLTGRLPFEGPMTRVLVQIATKDPPRLEVLRPDVDKELADICRQAMSRESSQRYQTAAEFEVALAAWMKSRPLTPRPKSRPSVEAADEPGAHQTRDAQSEPVLPVADQQSGIEPPSRNRKATKVSLAAFLFTLAAVIVIQISDRAELIIKSKVEGVEVKVIQLAQPEQERTLTIGENSMRVRSGKVEVVLTGANADDYEVVGDNIVLKRFGREVVEIRRRDRAVAKADSRDGNGWHGWPAGAPPPAIAPFRAAQAEQHQEAWATYLNLPVEYTNSIGMKFRLIPPGEFMMGSTAAEIQEALKSVGNDKHSRECIKSEVPQHKVILTQPIYLGVNEVTQAEYEKVMGLNSSHFSPVGMGKEVVAGMKTTEHPVEMVSWNDAAEFCAKLSKQEKLKPFYFRAGETITPLAGTGYRLPSEAEWEFACRAGTASKYWCGDQHADLMRGAWLGSSSGGRTHAAGELQANPFGLQDICGNVSEWVQDGWEATWYGQFQDKTAVNPDSPLFANAYSVHRGGGYAQNQFSCRSSSRGADLRTSRIYFLGFRVSLVVNTVQQALKVDGPKIVKPGVPTGPSGNPLAEQGRSAWDDLDPAQIPEAERVPRQPEGLVAVLGQHRRRLWDGPRSTSVSSDGTQFSLTTDDGLYLFDRDPTQPARFFNLGLKHPSATFLPDGRIAAFVHDGVTGHQLQIYAKPRDGVSLEKQTATTSQNPEAIYHATASSDGRWVAAFVVPSSIGLWRLGDAPPQRAANFVLRATDGNIPPLSFSPNAKWFSFTDTSQGQSTIHLIDLQGDTPRESTVLKAEADDKSDAPAKGFLQGLFLSDGRLATADRNDRIWFWNVNDGEPRQVGSIRDTGLMVTAANSLRLAIIDGVRFRTWNLAVDPPQLLGTASSSFPVDNVATLAIAPNGEAAITGHLNGAVRFWNVASTGITELDPLTPNPSCDGAKGRAKVVDHVLCSSQETNRVGIWKPTRDGLQNIPETSASAFVLTASSAQRMLIVREALHGGGTAILRCDADRLIPVRRINGDDVYTASLSDEDGRRVAISRYNGADDVIELWGWESDERPARKLSELKLSPGRAEQLAFAESGRVLIGRLGPQIQIWDVKDNQLIPRTMLPQHSFLQLAVAPDGQTLGTVGYPGLELWDLKSDLTQPTTSFMIPWTTAVAFSPDGRRLAASFWENGASAGVQIINLATGVVEKRLTFPGRVHELTFTDDSRHLITGNANGTVYVVRLDEFKPKAATKASPPKTTSAQTFSPSPASSPWDTLDPAQIPEAERVPFQPKELVAVLGEHRQRHWAQLASVAIRPDGKQAATCAEDGIRFWDLRTFQEQAHLSRLNTPGLGLGATLSLLYTPDGRSLLVGQGVSTPENPLMSEIDVAALPPKLTRSWKLPNNWYSNTTLSEISSTGRFLSGLGYGTDNKSFLVERTEAGLKPVADFPDGWRVSLAPDEKSAAVSTRDGGPVRLFGLQDNKLTEKTLLTGSTTETADQPLAPLRDAKFSPDGRLLVIDAKIIPWFYDVKGAEPKLLSKLPLTGWLPSFAKDGNTLVARDSNGSYYNIWSIGSRQAELRGSINDRLPRNWVALPNPMISGTDVSPDGKLAVLGHLNGSMKFIDISSSDLAELHPVKPNPTVSYFYYARPLRIGDHGFTAMSEEPSHVLSWHLETGRLQRSAVVEEGFGRPLATSADGLLLVNFEGLAPRVVIRRREQNAWRAIRNIPSTTDAISGALSRDQRWLVIGSNAGEIELWDLEARPARKLWTHRTPQNQAVLRLHFAMNEKLLVTQAYHMALVQKITDAGLEQVLTVPGGDNFCMDVDVNGGSMVLASNNAASVWSLATDPPEQVHQLTALQTSNSRSVAYSPDGRQLAVSHANGQVWLHDLLSGTISRKLQLPGSVNHVLFTTDNRHLLTANGNGTIYVLRLNPALLSADSDRRPTQ